MNMYPIQDGPSVPYEVMAPHEKQCQSNHQQSIARIAEHGGFGASEAWAVVNGLGFNGNGLDDGTTFDQARLKWFEYAERINLHYAQLASLEKERAVLLAKLAQLESEKQRLIERLERKTQESFSLSGVVEDWKTSCEFNQEALKTAEEQIEALLERVESARKLFAEIEDHAAAIVVSLGGKSWLHRHDHWLGGKP